MYQELRKVLQYIVDQIDGHKLATTYSELAQAYEKVAASSTPETTEIITKGTEAIKTAQQEINLAGFDLVSLHAFQRLDVNNVLGTDAIIRFDTELSQISNNPHAASTAIQNMANQITELRTTAFSTLQSLTSLWGEIKTLESGYVELQVVFEDKVAINTFKNMEHQADFWDRFLQVTNHVLSDGTDKAEIIALFKINPSGVSIKTKAKNALLILEIFSNVLAITTNLTQFKKAETNIYLLPSTDAEKTELLDKLHAAEQKAIIKEIDEQTDKIVQKLNDIIPEGAQRNDSKNGIRAQLKEMYQFNLDGGSVAVVNVAEDQKATITPEYYKLPEQTKLLQNTRKELSYPEFPKALLSADEKKIMKHPPAVIPTPVPIPTSAQGKSRRGRPPKKRQTEIPAEVNKPVEPTEESKTNGAK